MKSLSSNAVFILCLVVGIGYFFSGHLFGEKAEGNKTADLIKSLAQQATEQEREIASLKTSASRYVIFEGQEPLPYPPGTKQTTFKMDTFTGATYRLEGVNTLGSNGAEYFALGWRSVPNEDPSNQVAEMMASDGVKPKMP
jgi:hypothetical protein